MPIVPANLVAELAADVVIHCASADCKNTIAADKVRDEDAGWFEVEDDVFCPDCLLAGIEEHR